MGFYDREKVVDLEVLLQFGSFGVVQGSFTGFGRELMITRMVCWREVKGQEVPGQFGRQAGPLPFDHALKDGGVACHGFNMDETSSRSIPDAILRA